MIGSVDTQTAAGKCFLERADIHAAIAVLVRLHPSITGRQERRVARLRRQRIHDEAQEYCVATSRGRVGASSFGKAVYGNKGSVDVMQHVGPDFADSCRRRVRSSTILPTVLSKVCLQS